MNLNIKIDVTKILKEHLFQGKNGAKYLDLTVWQNRDGEDNYGNTHMVVQSLPRELRDAGEKGPILGNGKVFGQPSAPQQAAPPRRQSTPGRTPVESPEDDFEDDIPF